MDTLLNVIGTIMLIAAGFGFFWVLSYILTGILFED